MTLKLKLSLALILVTIAAFSLGCGTGLAQVGKNSAPQKTLIQAYNECVGGSTDPQVRKDCKDVVYAEADRATAAAKAVGDAESKKGCAIWDLTCTYVVPGQAYYYNGNSAPARPVSGYCEPPNRCYQR
jgi:hypothetical protein